MAIGLLGLGRHRDKGADQPQFLAPLKLLAALVDIVDIEHTDTLQPLGIGFAEIGDPIIVDAADLGQHFAVRDAVPEEALARLQARPSHPVLFILSDHRMRIVATLADVFPDAEEIDLRGIFETLPRLHHRTQGANLHAIEHPGVVLSPARGLAALHFRRPIAEPRFHAPGIHVWRLNDVRICRNQLVLGHYRPPPFMPAMVQSRPYLPIGTECPAVGSLRRGSAISTTQPRAPDGTTAAFLLDQMPLFIATCCDARSLTISRDTRVNLLLGPGHFLSR